MVVWVRWRSLISNPPTLEELFLREYGDELPAVSGDGETAAAGAESGAPR
jgi:ABC-2 type transport system ATP-binding protein